MKKVNINDQEKFYSIEKRKELAAKYNEDEQFVINMTREQYMAYVMGAVAGEKAGAMKALEAYGEDIKNGFQKRIDAVQALIDEALEEDATGELDTNLLDDIMMVLRDEGGEQGTEEPQE